MNVQLLTQINRTWAAHFKLSAEIFERRGTTFVINRDRAVDDWVLLWHIGPRTVVELAQAQFEGMASLLHGRPGHTRLTHEMVVNRWGDLSTSHDNMYALDEQAFAPTGPAAPYTVRRLTIADQVAFDQFQAACSEADRDDGEVGLDHEIATGVLHGERIVAAASMYEWRGSSDIGVLVDPAYRRQRLGTAATSHLCDALLAQNHERVIVYRHEIENVGSQRVARRLNFTQFGTVDAISPPPLDEWIG